MRIETHLMLCVDMLREANSPYPWSSKHNEEWRDRRDRLVRSADETIGVRFQPVESEET